MKTIQKSNESARQQFFEKCNSFISTYTGVIKRSTVLPLLIGIFVVSACQEKSNGQETSEKKTPIIAMDSMKPKVNIQVNRRYDDKGNLIGFDSTYSTYYSTVKGDTVGMDTLFNQFGRFFQRHHSSMMNNDFNALFFRDSLMYPDFFHDDFFLKRYELNDQYLRGMMKHMDSVKNNFYKEQSMRPKNGKSEKEGRKGG